MARRCRNCGESMPMDALLCAKCGKATDESFTRLTDPDLLGSARFGPRKYIEPLSVPLHGAAAVSTRGS